MKTYEVWFQGGHIMMVIEAKNSQDARKRFNKYIAIKEVKQ